MIQLGLAIVVIGFVILLQGWLSGGGKLAYDATSLGLSGLNGFFIYCLAVGGVGLSAGILTFGLWKNWFNCHRTLMPIVQRIPTIGTALSTLGLARLSMTLSMLLNAGVDAKRSTKQAFLATGNYYYISGMDRALAVIDRGGTFGEAFAEANVFPDEFIELVQIGELSGTETESLDHLAHQYRERAKAALATIASIASMTVWLGTLLIVGFMVVRMGLQLTNFYNDISKPGGLDRFSFAMQLQSSVARDSVSLNLRKLEREVKFTRSVVPRSLVDKLAASFPFHATISGCRFAT